MKIVGCWGRHMNPDENGIPEFVRNLTTDELRATLKGDLPPSVRAMGLNCVSGLAAKIACSHELRRREQTPTTTTDNDSLSQGSIPMNETADNYSAVLQQDIDRMIRSMPSRSLIRWALLSPENPNHVSYIQEIANRIELRRGISEYDNVMSDPRSDPLSPANIMGCDLIIRRLPPPPPATPEQQIIYGEDEVVPDGGLRWYVGCIRPEPPGFGMLPAMLPTASHALSACARLMSVGLHTYEALSRRIKIDRDWRSVRQIIRGELEAS